MNEIVNKFLLAGDILMSLMHLTQPGSTYINYVPFTKNKERIQIQKFKEAGDSRYIYQNELDKSCFQHELTYGDFKDLPRKTASKKVLHDKAFNIVKNLKYERYQTGLASLVHKFFEKKVVLLHVRSLRP